MAHQTKMTRQHFELIAATLARLGGDHLCFDDAEDRVTIAKRFAAELARTNANFKAEVFIHAATLDGDIQ